jgi:uncharacterized membrane protein YkvA (DUF1232 family)
MGLDDVFIITAVLSIIAAVLSLFLRNTKVSGAPKQHVMGE